MGTDERMGVRCVGVCQTGVYVGARKIPDRLHLRRSNIMDAFGCMIY